MKNTLKVFILTFVLFATTASTVSAQKFGHINTAELLTQMPSWKAAEKELETYSKQLENQLVTMNQDYERKAQKLQEDIQAGIINKVQEQERYQEILVLQQSMQEFSVKAQRDVAKKEEQLVTPIIENTKSAIEQVATEGGYSYIFDLSTGTVLHYPAGDDITALVKAKLGI